MKSCHDHFKSFIKCDGKVVPQKSSALALLVTTKLQLVFKGRSKLVEDVVVVLHESARCKTDLHVW